MTLSEAIREMLHRSRMSQKDLCTAAGVKNQSSLGIAIMRGDMHVSNLIRYANAAGYEVMLVDPNSKYYDYMQHEFDKTGAATPIVINRNPMNDE